MTVTVRDGDEVWTTKDGREIAVGDMTEAHVRNVLRMLIRKTRKRAITKNDESLFPDEQFFERPDNPTILAGLRRQHGDSVRVERSSAASMGGSNVYVGDRHIGWFGGI